MKNTTVLDILKESKYFLEEPGIVVCKNTYWKDHKTRRLEVGIDYIEPCQVCLQGAILWVSYLAGEELDESQLIGNTLNRIFQAIKHEGTYESIPHFNDQPEIEKEDLIRVIDRAIELEEKGVKTIEYMKTWLLI